MELLPCPFCGGEALPTAHLTYNWFAPVCGRCNARGPSVKIERDSDPQEMRNLMNQADENWNRRASPASAPEGWKLVPVEPTEEMVNAFKSADLTELRRYGVTISRLLVRFTQNYRALLAAAPNPPSTEDRKDAERYRWLLPRLVAWQNKDFENAFLHHTHETIEDAIDAAMQEDKS